MGQRAATALAREGTYERVAATIHGLLELAQTGTQGVRVQAARELREWLKLAGLDTGELPGEDVLDPRDMSPQQRAAARARLLAELAREQQADA